MKGAVGLPGRVGQQGKRGILGLSIKGPQVQSWALARPSAQLRYFLGAQVGALYSDFG